MYQRPAIGAGIKSMGYATDLLYSSRADKFGGLLSVFSMPQRYTLHAWAVYPYMCPCTRSLWESVETWEALKVEKYTEESPPVHSVASPPGIIKGGATAPRSTTLERHRPISCAMSLKHTQSLCAGGWKQGSPLHRAREPKLGDCSLGWANCVPWQL